MQKIQWKGKFAVGEQRERGDVINYCGEAPQIENEMTKSATDKECVYTTRS